MDIQDIQTEKKTGISGSTLKIIAIITMFIDHIGAVVLERFMEQGTTLYTLDFIFRAVGRVAFPIFCFLLIEGFIYTRSKRQYAVRLFVFALISEIPFNLANTGDVFNWNFQNVFFTLLFGFLTICALDATKRAQIRGFSGKAERGMRFVLTVLIMAAGMATAYFFNTDYSFAGVLAIVVMYSLRDRKAEEMFLGCTVLTAYNFLEAFAFVDIILINLYNGRRGLKLKYVFYAFYPVHLLLLYFVAIFLGAVK